MYEVRNEQQRAVSPTVKLVLTALGRKKLSDLSEVLKSIADSSHAYGCVLWQVAPEFKAAQQSNQGHLFVLAQWFQDKQIPFIHDLPLEDSFTGAVVLTQRSANTENAIQDSLTNKEHPFLREANINTMYSVPIHFIDGPQGAVNLYRKGSAPFSPEEVALIEEMAALVPALYQTLRDEVSLNLLSNVNDFLHKAELRARNNPLSKDEVQVVIQNICHLVTDTFNCLETSIFLEDRLVEPGLFKLMATTWPWPDNFKKKAYQLKERGLTGWVLTNKKPIKIFDLAHFERDKAVLHHIYHGLTWKDSLKIVSAVRSFLRLGDADLLPPLSFMAVPIVMGEQALGVIRCCFAIGGPYYFADRELILLNLVAAQISRYWNIWLGRREMQEENQSWRIFVERVGELNSFVQNELKKEEPDEQYIFDKALSVTHDVIKGTEIMDVRLLDEATNELYFVATHGKAWDEGSKDEIEQRKRRRFPIALKPPMSAGAHVLQTGDFYSIPDVRQDTYYSATFPGTKRMLLAPIKVKNETIGVIDIRSTGSYNFPRNARNIAVILGQQLGFYYYLATTTARLRTIIDQLHQAEIELKELVRTQTQTFQDLEHQLKSPIIQAHARIQALLRDAEREGLDEKLMASLFAIRGLCGKAKRVAKSTGLFANLSRKNPIQPILSRLRYDPLVRLLIEAAKDYQLMLHPDRSVDFYVDAKSFEPLNKHTVMMDYDLLEQAINDLMGNAYKYSFNGTEVRIYGGFTRTERFHISVVNKGLTLRAQDIQRCLLRGWRSERAALTTGEGSGIGLWIVDNIMKAHGGEVLILPTNTDGFTEFKLVFPTAKTG